MLVQGGRTLTGRYQSGILLRYGRLETAALHGGINSVQDKGLTLSAIRYDIFSMLACRIIKGALEKVDIPEAQVISVQAYQARLAGLSEQIQEPQDTPYPPLSPVFSMS